MAERNWKIMPGKTTVEMKKQRCEELKAQIAALHKQIEAMESQIVDLDCERAGLICQVWLVDDTYERQGPL
jgi:predicted RNase H-like nuclease (RuvC/YqgF family)